MISKGAWCSRRMAAFLLISSMKPNRWGWIRLLSSSGMRPEF